MSTMTVNQFKRYLGTLRYSRIIFCSENQNWDRTGSPVNLCLSFGKIFVALNPNMVCLKSENNMVYFERVKNVRVDTELSVLGVVLDVVCEDIGGDVCYTLVAE